MVCDRCGVPTSPELRSIGDRPTWQSTRYEIWYGSKNHVPGAPSAPPGERVLSSPELAFPIFLGHASRKVDRIALMFDTLVIKQEAMHTPGNEKNGRTADG
jgi:hypothetical protein